MLRLKLLLKRNQYGIYLIRYMLTAVILAVITIAIDHDVWHIRQYIPKWLSTSSDTAQTILTTLSGSLLSITTFTFSTILTVLSIYSSNFTASIVENFINKKITMKVLGTYVGGFLYSIISLWALRKYSFDRILSGTIAVIFSIVCIIYFVFFVLEVVRSIQTSNVITDLYERAADAIDLNEDMQDKSEGEKFVTPSVKGQPLFNEKSGYLAAIEYEPLKKQLDEFDGRLQVYPMIGDYVPQGMVLASVWAEGVDLEELAKKFVMEDQVEDSSDFHYAITKIVEIVLRAVASSNNDPNTAIQGIQRIGELISIIASKEENYLDLEGESSMIRIRQYDLKKELHSSYEQIIHYGKEDVSVCRAVLQSLFSIYANASQENKLIVKEFEGYIFSHIEDGIEVEEDLEKLRDLSINQQEKYVNQIIQA